MGLYVGGMVVTTTNDSLNGDTSSVAAAAGQRCGDGISLREAITAANNTAGTDHIGFSIGSGVQTINLTALLPDISSQVVIDGTTQNGFASAPLIVLNGQDAVLDGLRLYSGSDGSTIRGLVIQTSPKTASTSPTATATSSPATDRHQRRRHCRSRRLQRREHLGRRQQTSSVG